MKLPISQFTLKQISGTTHFRFNYFESPDGLRVLLIESRPRFNFIYGHATVRTQLIRVDLARLSGSRTVNIVYEHILLIGSHNSIS